MHPIAITVGLLLCSNVFMTFAWYAHLKELNNKPWVIAALVSWLDTPFANTLKARSWNLSRRATP
jgi:uncharacterized protein (DUF486 family)